MTRQIPLANGRFALIDDEDAERVLQHRWWLHGKGRTNTVYAAARIVQGTTLLHRFILNVSDPDIHVDHIDLDGLNCCKSNLRIATHQQNQRNRAKYNCNTTGYKGVFRNPSSSKWRAMITVNGKCVHIGYFVDIIDAARAYDEAAIMYFGEYARTNF